MSRTSQLVRKIGSQNQSIRMYVMTHSCAWHVSFIRVTWLVYVCHERLNIPFSLHARLILYVWHASFICVTWLIHVCHTRLELLGPRYPPLCTHTGYNTCDLSIYIVWRTCVIYMYVRHACHTYEHAVWHIRVTRPTDVRDCLLRPRLSPAFVWHACRWDLILTHLICMAYVCITLYMYTHAFVWHECV